VVLAVLLALPEVEVAPDPVARQPEVWLARRAGLALQTGQIVLWAEQKAFAVVNLHLVA